MFTKTKSFALAALAATGLAVAAPLPALADGSPVSSLGVTVVGPMSLPFYIATATPVYNTTSTPVTTARIIGYGQAPDFAPIYDTTAVQGVTTRPVVGVRTNGENVDVEYDNEAAARAPHAAPDFGGHHNPALSNLETLPRSLR